MIKVVTKIVNISMKGFIISLPVSKELYYRLCVLDNLITYCYYSILYNYHKNTVFKRYNSAARKSLRQLKRPLFIVSETQVFNFSVGLNFNIAFLFV